LESERPSTYETLNVPRAPAERERLQPGLW
jgi:uracil-DNA glycosylase